MTPSTRRPRTRAPRNRVRKRDRTVQNLPGDGNPEEDNFETNEEYISIGGVDTTNEGIAKSRKRKRDEQGQQGQQDNNVEGDEVKQEKKAKEGKGEQKQQHNPPGSNLLKAAQNKKRQERRKAAAARSRAKAQEGEKGNKDGDKDGEVEKTEAAQDNEEKKDTEDTKQDDEKKGKDHRFIVFVGNLSYTTTQASLSAHLATVKPTSVRVATFKPGEKPKGYRKPKSETSETGKEEPICKGYAFVEFPDSGKMRTCLALFHHSDFEGRKINVELTAGGGGKSIDRRERVKAKNESLNEERRRTYEEERKKKLERGEKVEEKAEEEEADDGIHPSRRKRVRR